MLERIPIWTRSIRRGVSPLSLIRRMTGDHRHLRYKGVNIVGEDMEATWSVADDIWGVGTYDVPGFVPQPGWNIVDIGGNVGLYAINAASRGARVTAYEPHPASARSLRANTANWDVTCVEAAVVGTPTSTVELYVNPTRDIRNTLVPSDVRTGSALTESVSVDTVPIRDALAEPVDLLKIDCEGGEFDIFANAGESLRNARRIIGEIHTNVGDPDRALADVRGAGFDARLEPVDPEYPYLMLTAKRLDA